MRTPAVSVGEALDGGARRHQQAQFELQQRRAEVHIAGACRRGVGEGHVDLPQLERLDDFGHAGKLDHLHRHLQRLRHQAPQLQRHAGRFARLGIFTQEVGLPGYTPTRKRPEGAKA